MLLVVQLMSLNMFRNSGIEPIINVEKKKDIWKRALRRCVGARCQDVECLTTL